MASIDVQSEYDSLRSFYNETADLLDQPDDVLFGVEPSVSGWSPAQHLYHVWLANGKSLAAALYITQGRGETDGSPNEIGRAVLMEASVPRHQMKAPESVTPPDDPDRKVLTETLTRSRGKFDDLGARLDALSTANGRLPHPRLGALNGPQWLRFVRVHAQHHHAIIRDILNSEAPRSP